MTDAVRDALAEILELCAIGDVDECTEALGWGKAIQRARAALSEARAVSDWRPEAAKWLRLKAAEQAVTNAKYPAHAESYPSWRKRVLDLGWLADELEKAATTLSPAEQPAPRVCKGIPRVGCNYLAECDSVCNKCGKVHAVHLIPGVGSTAPVERVQLSDTKPLDDPRLQQLFGDAIEGALAFGYQGENAAPPGHWLERFWHLGRAEAEKTLAATPPPMPARLNDQRIVELMRPLADDALIRPHVIAAARAVIAEYERLNGISATPRQPLSDEQIAQLWSPHPGGEVRRPIIGWAKVRDFADRLIAEYERSNSGAVRQPLSEAQIIDATERIDPKDGYYIRIAHAVERAHGIVAANGACQPAGLMFDALGEPRKRYVRVTLDGNHCVMSAIEGDAFLSDARSCGDESPYVVADVYLSEREFDDLPEHGGF